jgi:hypothetical protein
LITELDRILSPDRVLQLLLAESLMIPGAALLVLVTELRRKRARHQASG